MASSPQPTPYRPVEIAIELMAHALALLDQAGEKDKAVYLQHALEVARGVGPMVEDY